MRILILSAAYKNSSGGVATHVINLAHGLVEEHKKDHVHVVTLRKPGHGYLKDRKGRLTEWKHERKSGDEFSGRRVVLGNLFEWCYREWHEIDAEVIHAHDWDSLLLGWMLRTAFGLPLIATVHRAPTKWRRLRFRENSKDCLMETVRTHEAIDHLCVPSRASRKVLEKQGFQRRDITVIPHGISQALLSFHKDVRVSEELQAEGDARVILCPARADEHKDPHTFVRAAGLVRKMLPDERLVFVVTCGTTDDDETTKKLNAELRALAGIHGLREGADLLFARHLSYGDELYTAYSAAEIVVVPSVCESFGQAVLDGFMFSKPVIARNSTGLRETVRHQWNGLLFETREQLANQIRQLLLDKKLASKLARNGKRDLEGRFDIGGMARSYRRVYKRVVNECGRRPRRGQ